MLSSIEPPGTGHALRRLLLAPAAAECGGGDAHRASRFATVRHSLGTFQPTASSPAERAQAGAVRELSSRAERPVARLPTSGSGSSCGALAMVGYFETCAGGVSL
jgi:hypothetical protein